MSTQVKKVAFLLPHLRAAGGVLAPLMFAHVLAQRGYAVTVAVESKSWTRCLMNMCYRSPLLPLFTKVKIVRLYSLDDLDEHDYLIAVSVPVATKLLRMPHTGKKFDYEQHDERLYHTERTVVDAVYKSDLRIIANATWLQKIFLHEYGKSVPVLLNAVDTHLFHPKHRTRKQHEQTIRVLVLCHDYEWKGTKEGVQIVNELKKEFPQLQLVLFGTRSPHTDYPCDEYHYMLHGKKLAELFANCDIFLGPSWDEGLNFPPRWAMASGCAVVTYENGATQDYAFDGQTALVAERKNMDELKEKLRLLVTDAELRNSIATKGRDYVQHMPTWDKLTCQLIDILEQHD